MNLDDFEALASGQEDGLDIELLDPTTGEKTGAVVVMAGPDTRTVRIAHARAIRHVLSQTDGREWTDDDEQEVRLRTTAGAVIGWQNIRKGEEELPFTFDNVLMLFRRFPWFQAQCDRKASDRRNFIKG